MDGDGRDAEAQRYSWRVPAPRRGARSDAGHYQGFFAEDGVPLQGKDYREATTGGVAPGYYGTGFQPFGTLMIVKQSCGQSM